MKDYGNWQKSGPTSNEKVFSLFIINAFLWGIWWFTSGRHGQNRSMPWPVWSMLGWGIGLFFQYLNAYGGDKKDLVEKEYEKLKNKKQA